MKTDPRWHFIGALMLAGLLSLYASFAGLTGLLWGGLGRQKFAASVLLLSLPLLLAFPLFMFASGSSRIASFAMWALGPAYSLALFQITSANFAGSFPKYLQLLLACMFDRMAIFLWITAWLVHFGTGIYNRRRDVERPAHIKT